MNLETILDESAKRHKHLCPRQVLGARMSLYAAELLGLELPRVDKRLLVTAETDGCAVDGIIAATHCRAGSRTLRILDFGKVAATFTDTCSGRSVRVFPSECSRTLASEYAQDETRRWNIMLQGYKVMPLETLFKTQWVQLQAPIAEIVGAPGKRTVCDVCGEEIINGREVVQVNHVLCRACAGDGYYQVVKDEPVHAK